MYQDPALQSHFSAFALCSAGRDVGKVGFEVHTIDLHIRFYIRALRAYLGSKVPLYVSISDLSKKIPVERIESELLTVVRGDFSDVECGFDDQRTRGQGYYSDLCFHVYGTNHEGKRLELVDGGSVDWTQQLLSNDKERLVISGIGSERVCTEFSRRSIE
jgi:hypothetical protein